MKILLQSTLLTPLDFVEFDSAEWPTLPKKPAPPGTVDEVVGWAHSLNVQGVEFTADHYHIAEITDGVRVTIWNDDPVIHPPGSRYARVWDILFNAPDSALGGAISTHQSEIVYAEPTKFAQLNDSGPVENRVLREWGFFIPPTSNVMHGKEVDDRLHGLHLSTRSIHGWREWTEGLNSSEIENGKIKQQRSQGRFNPAKGTRTYFQRDIERDTEVHVSPEEVAFETAVGTSDTLSQVLDKDETKLVFVFTTSSGEPDTLAWPTGDYRCQLDCVTAGANIVYGLLTVNGGASGHFGRVDTGLENDLETKTQSEAQFSGTGLKLATTGSVSWTSGATTDRFECAIAAKNTNSMMSQETITIEVNTSDSFADGPWPSGGVTIPVLMHSYRTRRVL